LNVETEILQNMSVTDFVSDSVKDANGEDIIITKQKSGDFVVCNLSSLNLGKIDGDEDLEFVTTTAMRMMDNVIDLNYYPVPQAQVTNKKYRAVGLGSSGYHQMLAQSAIQWESDKHLDKADEIYEKTNYYAIKASMQNAIEKGTYAMFEGSEWQTGEYFDSREYTTGTRETHIPAEKWQELKEQVAKNGVRNAWMFAIAPTGLNIGPATA